MAPDPIPDDVLAACAAGELPPAEAEALRVRAASDPALAARLATAERVERALRADGLLPVPLALLSTVIDRVRGEPALGGALRPEPAGSRAAAGPVRRAAPERATAAIRRGGLAAATLGVALGLWAAASGFEPRSALGLPTTPAASALAEGLGLPGGPGPGGVGGSFPRAPTFDVTDAWAGLAPDRASAPGPSDPWIAGLWTLGGLALLSTAAVLARRFRPRFEAATFSPASYAPASPSPWTA